MESGDCRRLPIRIEATQEDAMPDQPADPVHYDMKVPPEPKNNEEERESAKKHGDKINSEAGSDDKNAEGEHEKGSHEA
jgi:hypothetical protein